MNRKGKMSGMAKGVGGTLFLVAVVYLYVFGLALPTKFTAPSGNPLSVAGGNAGAVTAPGLPPTSVAGQSPAYTYTSFDSKQTSNSVTGTTYIKQGAQTPVTSLAGPAAGLGLQEWTSNTTAFCDVVDANGNAIPLSQAVPDISSASAPALQGTHPVQSPCYVNATSVVLSAYNVPQNQQLTNGGGAQNLSTVVGTTNVQIYYQGNSKQSHLPFGGCIALEYPANVTSVSISGAGITGAACPYVWTYTMQNTADTYKLFAVPAGFDQNGAADVKNIAVQYTASTNKPLGKFYVNFQPANWYVGNDKAFHMGIEKDANADTAKTFGGSSSAVSLSFVGQ